MYVDWLVNGVPAAEGWTEGMEGAYGPDIRRAVEGAKEGWREEDGDWEEKAGETVRRARDAIGEWEGWERTAEEARKVGR